MMITIDRSKNETLCDQIAEGFRRAIAVGEYKPGDKLPHMRELSVSLGVSIRVVVRAFAKLEAARLVSGRRGVGCVVEKPPKSLWKGQIVVIVPGGDYVYCQNICAGIVCDRLSVRGYMVQRVTVPSFGRNVYDFRSLDLLLRLNTSLVVMIGPQQEIERHLAAANVRYVVIGQASVQSAKCMMSIGNDALSAIENFAAHAARAGVRNAILVGANYSELHPMIFSALISKSIKVKEWKIRTGVHVSGRLDVMQVNTRDFFRAKLCGGEKLPDLFVFIDEYRAMGGALALYEAGVKIPEDVGFVTVSNVGNGPVLSKGVARIEYNPFKNGRRIADMLFEFLSTGKFPSNAIISACYVPDDTFPRC